MQARVHRRWLQLYRLVLFLECKVFFYTITADINECETLNETCSDGNAECVNTVDGYNCTGLSGRMDL